MGLNKGEEEYEKKVAWVWGELTQDQRQIVKKKIDAGEFDQRYPDKCLICMLFPGYNKTGTLFGQFTGRKYSEEQEKNVRDVYLADIGKDNPDYYTTTKLIKAYVKSQKV